MVDDLRARLSDELAEVCWRDLRPHADRNGLLLVGVDLDVVDATLAVVRDDRATVEAWLGAGRLARPTEAQLSRWTRKPDTRFECLIAQPFVLARECLT